MTKPYACDPSSLPKYPPSKEMDAKLRDEEARRLRAAGKNTNAEGAKKTRTRERHARAIPAPEANAELQANIDRRRLITHANAKSKSEKFPPPHQDGTLEVLELEDVSSVIASGADLLSRVGYDPQNKEVISGICVMRLL
nr:probable serine/threonine-protein kinase At1g54610 [Tanacetum cinerariifolium]